MQHRRQYIINQDFQFRYIGLIIGLTCFVSLIFLLAMKYYLDTTLSPLIESGLITSPLANELIHIEKNFLGKKLLILFLSLISVLAVAGISITHRIAGPMYALERRMKQIAKEGIMSSEFRIRRTDEFQELAEAFNDMIVTLQKQINQKSDKASSQNVKEEIKKVA